MLKIALTDYFNCFKWKNFKNKANKFQFWWPFLYAGLIMPMSSGWFRNLTDGKLYYHMAILTVLIAMIGFNLSLKLPRQMFLIPLNQRQRSQYVTIVFFIRILIPTTFYSIAGAILSIAGIWKFGFVVLLAVILLSLFVLISYLYADIGSMKKIAAGIGMVFGIMTIATLTDINDDFECFDINTILFIISVALMIMCTAIVSLDFKKVIRKSTECHQ